ncbi:MAG: FtsX-like permease family protein [Planctomycetota bacterium]
MYVLFLALRYLLARAVSYLAIAAIAVGVGALIVVVSVMNGFLAESMRFVRGTTADIIVMPAQSTEGGLPASRTDYERLVASQPGVRGVCSRLVRPAIVKVHGANNLTINSTQFASLNQVVVLGVDPASELATTAFAAHLADVEDPLSRVDDPAQPFMLPRSRIADRTLRNADLPHVLVGEERLRQLGLSKGQALSLVTLPDGQDLERETLRSATETFIIAGAFRTKHHGFDMGHLLVEREAFGDWAATRTEVSEMAVSAVSAQTTTELNTLRDTIQSALDSARLPAIVETWRDRHQIYLGAVENERNILGFVLALFVLLTCTISFSMLTMMVQEKIRDIGILSAMGAPASGVGGVFAACGALIATTGGLFGWAAGTLVARNVNGVKDWIENTFGIQIFRKDVYAFSEIPTVVNFELNAAIVGASIFFGIVICLVPALRAARMDPVEALRHE